MEEFDVFDSFRNGFRRISNKDYLQRKIGLTILHTYGLLDKDLNSCLFYEDILVQHCHYKFK